MAKKVVSVLISMILIFSLSASVFAETKSELQKKKEEAQGIYTILLPSN